MTSEIKEKDFVRIDFIGKVKETNQIFDLTKKDVAEKQGIFDKDFQYKPTTICVNSGQTLKGIDEALLGKQIGEKFTVEIPPEKGFGKRDPKLVQLTSEANFRKKGVRPSPGMQFDVDGKITTIRSVSGGRVVLDFNHPLAGRTLIYEIEIKEKVEKPEDRLNEIKNLTGMNFDFKVDKMNVEINLKLAKPEPKISEIIEKNIQSFLPDLKVVVK